MVLAIELHGGGDIKNIVYRDANCGLGSNKLSFAGAGSGGRARAKWQEHCAAAGRTVTFVLAL